MTVVNGNTATAAAGAIKELETAAELYLPTPD
jgi:hypothetical protein